VYLPPDPASRTAYAAGEVAQCDLWFPAITLPVGFGQTRTATRLPVLVMVTGYARWLAARLLPSRVAEDLFAGWWQLINQLGRCRGCWCGTARPRSASDAGVRRS
jgi:transposase